MSADREIFCSQSPDSLEHHQKSLESGGKVMLPEDEDCGHRFMKRFCGKSFTYVLIGALLAVCLLGSVGFLVTHLGFPDGYGNHEAYDRRVLVVKRLMRDSPLIGTLFTEK